MRLKANAVFYNINKTDRAPARGNTQPERVLTSHATVNAITFTKEAV